MSQDTARLSPENHAILTPFFDPVFYRTAYPDIPLDVDPLEHYHHTGWREGRDPSRNFNSRYYLTRYPDIAAAGINPLLHYVLAGRHEGRDPTRMLDGLRTRVEQAQCPREAATHWGPGALLEVLNPTQLAAALDVADLGLLIVSLSHDDYARSTGGVQNLIADEQASCEKLGWHYLHLSPARPLPLLADAVDAIEFRVNLRLGRNSIGQCTLPALVDVLGAMRRKGRSIEVIIHHLMGFAPEHVLMLLESVECRRPLVWVHDFFTLCPSYTLLRNDVVFCNAPDINSGACGICCYGAERQDHSRRMRTFFEGATPIVLAPSQPALKTWLRLGGFPHSEAHAVPLAELVLAPSGRPFPAVPANRVLRIGHLGARAFHKGWPIFEALALRFADDPRYSFVQLGVSEGPPRPACVDYVPVAVTRDTRNAMIHAAAEAGVDVVLNWPAWPETFCFAAHEAIAAGAFLITRPGSGNILPMIETYAPDQGYVVADEASLVALFEGNELMRQVARCHRRRGALILGGGSVDWLKRRMTTSSFLMRYEEEQGKVRSHA